MNNTKEIAEAIQLLQESGVSVETGDLIEVVYKKLCADILHTLLCEAPDHTTSCDYYSKGSEKAKEWIGIVEERMELLTFTAEQLYRELSTLPMLLTRNIEPRRLRLMAWLINHIAERAPRYLTAAVDSSVGGVVQSEGESGFPKRF